MTKSSDIKFFTNTEDYSLYERFLSTVKDAQNFDILVGYFRTSGFFRLYKKLEKVDKIRVLVGLDTDRRSFELLEEARAQAEIDFESHKRCREIYVDTLTDEIEVAEDSHQIEIAAHKFIEFIQSGKLELRAHPSSHL